MAPTAKSMLVLLIIKYYLPFGAIFLNLHLKFRFFCEKIIQIVENDTKFDFFIRDK